VATTEYEENYGEIESEGESDVAWKIGSEDCQEEALQQRSVARPVARPEDGRFLLCSWSWRVLENTMNSERKAGVLRLGGDEPVSDEEDDLTPGGREPDDMPSPTWVKIQPFGGRLGENLDSFLRRFARAVGCAVFPE